jgi:hypothetical protein
MEARKRGRSTVEVLNRAGASKIAAEVAEVTIQ